MEKSLDQQAYDAGYSSVAAYQRAQGKYSVSAASISHQTTTVETETPVWCSIGNGNTKQIINDLRRKSVSPLGIYS